MSKTVCCNRCNRRIEPAQAVAEVKNTNEILILCKKCASLYGHCAACSMFKPCAFFEDPDPMPQFVVVTQRTQQGNTTFVQQRQVPNPERAKKFCQDADCKCLHTFEDGSKICCRHSPYTTCTNYEELIYQINNLNEGSETE